MLFSPQILVRTPPKIIAAAPSTTSWNPSDKNAGITLTPSGGFPNLTATTTGNQSVRSIASRSGSGKYYCEGALTRFGNAGLGIANSGYSLSGFIGSTTNAVGCLADNRVFLGGSQIGTGSFINASGNRWCMAVDFGNMRIWFRTDAGNWNNSGTADPATNTLGIDISGLAAGPYFVIWNGETSGDAMTMNFGATAYAQAVPSGFGNW